MFFFEKVMHSLDIGQTLFEIEAYTNYATSGRILNRQVGVRVMTSSCNIRKPNKKSFGK